MNESCKKSRYDRPFSLFSLCLSVLPNAAALRTLVVLGVQLLRTSKLLKKKQMNLFMMRGGANHDPGSPECWDIAGLGLLCRGTWLMRYLQR
jgi:hypothetical protein